MLDVDWKQALLEIIARTGAEGRATVDYLRSQNRKIGFWRARENVGAFWTPMGNIRLNSRYYSNETPLNDPYLISIIVHEVRHLRQGFFTALSIYGELDAWQVGFRVYLLVAGHLPRHAAVEEIMSMPLGWDRDVLRRAQTLMQAYAGKGYRADLLPLYPLGREIWYRLTGKQPDEDAPY